MNGYRHSNCSMVHFYILGGAHSNLSKFSQTYSKLLPSRTFFSFFETSKTFLTCFYKLLRSSIGISIDFSELPSFYCVQNLPQVVPSSHRSFPRCFSQVQEAFQRRFNGTQALQYKQGRLRCTLALPTQVMEFPQQCLVFSLLVTLDIN